MKQKSLFEELGGEPGIRNAVNIFYRKVLWDKKVARFFEHLDIDRLVSTQSAFLTMLTGGPNLYSGTSLRERHRPLLAMGLNDGHVDVVIQHMEQTLWELGVADHAIAEVKALAESLRHEILDR